MLRSLSFSLSNSFKLSSSSSFQISIIRSFSTKDEPQFLVDWEGNEAHPESHQPAYLPDYKRMEIYYKHKSDPKEWSVLNISKRYGMSLMRSKAILYLMEQRVEHMKKLGVYNLSPKWQEVYNDHLAEPEVMTKEALAEKHSLPIEEIELILKNMEEHAWRKQNLHDSNEYHDMCLDYLNLAGIPPPTLSLSLLFSLFLSLSLSIFLMNYFSSLGVPTEFKETETVPGESNFDFEYFPQLFGDNDFEEERERLRAKVLRETKALLKKQPLLKTYESRVQNWRHAFQKLPGLREDPVQPLLPVDESVEISRWKFAFRELREKKKFEPAHPTVIITRDGRFFQSLFFSVSLFLCLILV